MNAAEVNQEFARNLQRLRARAGLTQQQLADAMTERGTRAWQATVAKIESGARTVSVGEAAAFADALGTEIGMLTGAIPAGGADAVLRALRADEEVRRRLLDDARAMHAASVARLRAAELRCTGGSS